MTTGNQLDQINSAILAIETGAQEYQIGSRKVVKADLATLYKERQRLEEKASSEARNNIFVSRFDGR